MADKRIGHDLERQRRKRFFVVGMTRQRFARVRVHALDFFGIEGGGQVIDDGIEERLHAFVLERSSNNHRK